MDLGHGGRCVGKSSVDAVNELMPEGACEHV